MLCFSCYVHLFQDFADQGKKYVKASGSGYNHLVTGAKKNLRSRNPFPGPRWPESTKHAGAHPAKKSFAHMRLGQRRKEQADTHLCMVYGERRQDCDVAFRVQAPLPSAAHGPARPLFPWAPSIPCALSCSKTPACHLALNSSSHDYLPTLHL